jgi:hypothetical protein
MYLGKEQAKGWRDEVIDFLNNHTKPIPIPRWNDTPNAKSLTKGYFFNILNPCNRWLEKGGELEAEGPFVVQMDKMEIAKSDVLIVNATNPGWGTPMEQYIGWSTGKMIICFSDCDFPSIWAKAHSHKMCRTHIEAADWLCNVAGKQLARVV